MPRCYLCGEKSKSKFCCFGHRKIWKNIQKEKRKRKRCNGSETVALPKI